MTRCVPLLLLLLAVPVAANFKLSAGNWTHYSLFSVPPRLLEKGSGTSSLAETVRL